MTPSLVIPSTLAKSYYISIVSGMLQNIQVYGLNVNGYRLYNSSMALDITWNGTDATDYLSGFNQVSWIWRLQYRSGPNWITIVPSSLTITVIQNADGWTVTRQGILSDGSSFRIDYYLSNKGPMKFTISYTPVTRQNYRLWFEVSGLQNENSYTYLAYNKPNAKRIKFILPEYIGMELDFDYNDVSASLTQSENFDATGFKYNYYVEVGRLNAGQTYTVDPTTVTTTAGQYATAYSNARHLIRDAYGKLIYVGTNANLVWAYCNSPPSGAWTSEDLGATYVVSATAGEGVCAVAYDSVNDKLMVAWVNGTNAIKCMQITFTRDGSNNITGKTLSSVLTITANKASRRPSLWMLHNGEVGLVYGDNSLSGGKHGDVHSCRVVFGSPPTYKNWAGTANQTTVLSSVYTTAHTTHTPAIAQRTNSGTGQYDLWAVWEFSIGGATYRNKLTFSTPNWTTGTEIGGASEGAVPCMTYQATGGFLYYALHRPIINDYEIILYLIDSNDIRTYTGKSGLPSKIRTGCNICINGSNLYVWYMRDSYIYYIPKIAGVWGSETQFSSVTTDNYPSVSLVTTSRIDVIWTHLVSGSDYDVYYDSLTLGGEPTTGWNKLQYFTEPPTTGAFNKLRFASEPPVSGSWNKLLYAGE